MSDDDSVAAARCYYSNAVRSLLPEPARLLRRNSLSLGVKEPSGLYMCIFGRIANAAVERLLFVWRYSTQKVPRWDSHE